MSALDEQIEGWKDIAKALRVHRNTARKWADLSTDPLPIRVNHLGVYAWRGALESWCDRRDKALQVETELESLRAEVVYLRGHKMAPDRQPAAKQG